MREIDTKQFLTKDKKITPEALAFEKVNDLIREFKKLHKEVKRLNYLIIDKKERNVSEITKEIKKKYKDY